ncbi:MAG: DUF998 domain-containing protein [bacterium]
MKVAATIRLQATSWFVLSAVALFVAATVFENAVQGPAASSRPVSELALGQNGALLDAAFILVGFGLVLLAWALHRTVVPGQGKRRACRLLVVAGPQIGLLGVFHTDRTLVPSTPSGWIHFILAGSSFLLILIAFVVFSRAFRRDPRWRLVGRASTFTTWLAVGAFVAHLVPVVGPPAAAPYEGVMERFLIAAYLLWVVVSGVHLQRVARAWPATQTTPV